MEFIFSVLCRISPNGPALLDVRHAGGVADAQVVVRAERDAGHGDHFLGFEELRAKLRGLQARAADVWEEPVHPINTWLQPSVAVAGSRKRFQPFRLQGHERQAVKTAVAVSGRPHRAEARC